MKNLLRCLLVSLLLLLPEYMVAQCPACKSPSGNLVKNGNFEAGNVDFVSDYTYQTDLTPEGTYYIGSNPSTYHVDFKGKDHTTGAGNFMIINGETSPGMNVWCQTITVTPGTDYSFSTWVCSVHPSNPAILQFSINGVTIGAVFNAPGAINVWQEFFVTWNSGASTTATICIENQATAAGGNDFGLDDISFSPCIPFSATVTKTVNCKNSDDTLRATPSGGRAPYTYTWNTGSTSSFITNLSPGNYSVTVRDANGCTTNQSISVTAPQGPVVTLTAMDETCPGSADGRINSAVSGGKPPYTYLWSTGTTTSSLINLSPGLYMLTVTDAKGCQGTASKSIITKGNPFVRITGDTLICPGDSTRLTASGTAGTFLWKTGQVTQVVSVMPFADSSFIVQLTDINGCKAYDTLLVYVAPRPGLTLSKSNVLCNGTKTGKAMSSVLSGTPPYNYSWNTNPPQSTPDALGLNAGNYQCIVADSNGCKDTALIVVGEPSAITFTTSVTNALCGSANGKATVTATGGTGVLAYRWNTSPGQTTSTATGLAVGSYTCTITDANSCEVQATVAISNNTGPVASLQSKTDNKCFGDSKGTATVLVSNASGTISYRWNTVPEQTGRTATDLKAGNYSCIVSDASNCSSSVTVDITEPPALTVGTLSTPETCGLRNGTATVFVSGGTGTVSYTWSTSPVQNTATAVGLKHDSTYTVVVRDQAGCTKSTTEKVAGYAGIRLSMLGSTAVTCPGRTDGTIRTQVDGGLPPFEVDYGWGPMKYDTTLSSLAQGSYLVKVNDANKCFDSVPGVVPPADTIRASFIIAEDTCQRGVGSITTLAAGGAAPLSFQWNTSPVQSAISVMNLFAGNYTLTVTDRYNCSEVFSTVVSNIGGPAITGLVTKQPLCEGEKGTATVTANGNGPLAYSWNTFPPQLLPAAVNLEPGEYICRVTDINKCFDEITAVINMPNPLPVFSLGPDTAICEGDSILLRPDRTGDSYRWSTGDDIADMYARQQAMYKLILTKNGCSYSDSVFVRLDSIPPLELGKDSIFCGAFSVNHNIGVPGNATYRWSDGVQLPLRSIPDPGFYWAEISRGRCTARDSVIYGSQVPIFVSLPLDTQLCSGTSLTIPFASNAVNPKIQWNTGESSSTINVASSGVYRVLLTEGPCTAADSMLVTFHAVPNVSLGNDTNLCEGSTLVLNPGTPVFQHQWSNGQTSPVVAVTQSGTYSVTATNVICVDRDTINVTFIPVPVFELGPDTIICPGDQVQVGHEMPGVSYSWNTGQQTSHLMVGQEQECVLTISRGKCRFTDSLSVGLHLLPAIPIRENVICPFDTLLLEAPPGNYQYLWENGDTVPLQLITRPCVKTLTVTDTTSCSNTAVIHINPGADCFLGLYVPNAFTPNDDGINDFFFFKGEQIDQIALSIYDRWGELIFSKTSRNPVWDGTYLAEPVQSDVYAWRAVVITLDKKKKELFGKVTLLR